MSGFLYFVITDRVSHRVTGGRAGTAGPTARGALALRPSALGGLRLTLPGPLQAVARASRYSRTALTSPWRPATQSPSDLAARTMISDRCSRGTANKVSLLSR